MEDQLNSGTPCSGQLVRAGDKIETVNCRTQYPVTEQYSVPITRTVYRPETRTRTHMVDRTRDVPETRYRTEIQCVRRKIPYTVMKKESYQEPRVEQYTVSVPENKVDYETRTRTKFIQGTKQCDVKVPVYKAICGSTGVPSRVTDTYDTYDTSYSRPLVKSNPVTVQRGSMPDYITYGNWTNMDGSAASKGKASNSGYRPGGGIRTTVTSVTAGPVQAPTSGGSNAVGLQSAKIGTTYAADTKWPETIVGG